LSYDVVVVTPTTGDQVGEFGDKFRKARENKELSLDDVSNVTKISARMLQAIEQEHFDQLPGGVFNKGFIRAYAKHLGLNSEEAVTDYLACLRQAQIDAHEVWKPEPSAPVAVTAERLVVPLPSKGASRLSSTPDPKPDAPVQVEELPELQLPRVEDIPKRPANYAQIPSNGISWKLIGGVALILIIAIFLWTRRSHAPRAASAKSASAPAVSAPLAASMQPAAVPSAATAKPAQASASQAAATPPAKPSSTAQPSTSTAATNADKPEERIVRKGDVTIRSFGQPESAPVPPPDTKSAVSFFSVVIRATETSWISVTSDGQLVTQETLIAPANTTVRASREVVVRVGNAAGVTFLWNGKELSPQGEEAEAKTFVFDHDGMKALPGQAAQ
jgi:cytoskeletal protein RodZ